MCGLKEDQHYLVFEKASLHTELFSQDYWGQTEVKEETFLMSCCTLTQNDIMYVFNWETILTNNASNLKIISK